MRAVMRPFDGNRQDSMYPFMEFQGIFSICILFKGYKLKKAKGGCERPVLRRMRWWFHHRLGHDPCREINVEGLKQAVRRHAALRLLSRDDDSGAETLGAWWQLAHPIFSRVLCVEHRR